MHKDKSYHGEHDAIIDKALWDKVQAVLTDNRIDRENGETAKEPNLLTSLIFDALGNRMSPVHANKKGIRYRYYVSRQLQDGSATTRGQGQRIPAIALEGLVIRRFRQQLSDPAFVLDCAEKAIPVDAATQKRLIECARQLAGSDGGLATRSGLYPFIRAVLVRAQVHTDRIELTVNQDALTHWLRGRIDNSNSKVAQSSESESRLITLAIPARLKRAGKEMKIIAADGADPTTPDTSLVRLLARAQAIRQRLMADRSLTLEEIAKSEGFVPSYATRLYRLTVLAPDIVSTLLSGKQPPELTARRLMDDTRLPLAWAEQRQQLGFDNAVQ